MNLIICLESCAFRLIVCHIPLPKIEKKNLKYFIKNERDRFVNRMNFFHPFRFVYKVIAYYNISVDFKILIILFFLFSNIKLPFLYIKYIIGEKNK